MRLSIRQVAQRAGVSLALVYRWCEERRLPHYRLGGLGRRGRIQVEEADLDAFLESCKVEAGALRPDFTFTHRRH
jgi:excisionase family DNA binding protein